MFEKTFQKATISALLSIVLFTAKVSGWTTSEVFAKYPNPIFIETGSLWGDGIQQALDAGFQKVYSIELSPFYYEHCKQRFASDGRVEIIFGDSAEVLPLLLQNIDQPITFWLDGHWTGVPNSGKGKGNCPILQELAYIKNHPIKTHTLLIDDVRLFNRWDFDLITLDQVKALIKSINPKYRISLEDGYVPNDVLVAKVNP